MKKEKKYSHHSRWYFYTIIALGILFLLVYETTLLGNNVTQAVFLAPLEQNLINHKNAGGTVSLIPVPFTTDVTINNNVKRSYAGDGIGVSSSQGVTLPVESPLSTFPSPSPSPAIDDATTNGVHGYTGVVYTDWNLPSRGFSLINYQALERLLSLYKDSQVVFHLVAPVVAQYYKWRDRISKHQFQKYEKMGYNMTFKVVSSHPFTGTDAIKLKSGRTKTAHKVRNNGLLSRLGLLKGDKIMIKTSYFDEQMRRCCLGKEVKSFDSGPLLSFHFLCYTRLTHIYLTGGLFTDLRFYHHRSVLPSNIDFILMQPIEMDTDIDTDTEGMVPPSLLMYFMHPGSPFLECVLLEFDSETSLLQLCLVTSHPPGGKDASAECVQACFTRCIHSAAAQAAAQAAAGAGIDTPDMPPARGVCLIIGGDSSPPLCHTVDSNHSGDDMHRNSFMPFTVSTIRTPNAAVWALGAEAHAGRWRELDGNASEGLRGPIKRATEAIVTRRPMCSNYFIPPDSHSNKHTGWSSDQIAQATASCAPTFVIPGFMKAGTTFVYDVLTRHPQVLKALRGVVFKETGCYLDVAAVSKPERMQCFPHVSRTIGDADIPTSMSDFAFGDGTVTYATRRHVADQLYQENPHMRVLFCVRNPIQRLLSHYRFMLPPVSKLKNNAVAGAMTKHFFSVSSDTNISDSANINVILATALSTDSSVWSLHKDATAFLACSMSGGGNNLLSSQCSRLRSEFIDAYYYGVRSQFQRSRNHVSASASASRTDYFYKCVHLLIHSIYIAPILHWDSAFGSSGLLVASVELLQVNVSATTGIDSTLQRWNRIHRFLDISDWNDTSFVKTNAHATDGGAGASCGTTDSKSPFANDCVDADMHSLLVLFLKPFEDLLLEYVIATAVEEHIYTGNTPRDTSR